jgi:hypothetical protein
VYLIYLDDGGKGNVLVFGGIVVDHRSFVGLEAAVGLLASKLMPPDEGDTLKRFHASNLFLGKDQFKDIPLPDCHEALRQLVRFPSNMNYAYIYSAIDKHQVERSPAGSANPYDMAFRMVASAIEDFLRAQLPPPDSGIGGEYPLSLLIVDECDAAIKGHIRRSFRQMRQQLRMPLTQNRLSHTVDDLFFGSSVCSVGLQVADACNYVMWRRLAENIEDDFFMELMKGQVICAKPQPEWSQFRQWFRAHDE